VGKREKPKKEENERLKEENERLKKEENLVVKELSAKDI